MLTGVAVLVLLVVGATIAFPGFASVGLAHDLLTDCSPLGLAAIGMTFVILSGGIDLSVGAVIAFATVMIATLVAHHVSPFVAIPATLAVGAAFGTGMGWIVATFNLPPFLVTLAGMFLARGGAYIVQGQAIPIDHPFYDAVVARHYIGITHVRIEALIFLLALAVAMFVLHLRPFGRTVYAIGGNEQSALLMGLPVHRAKVLIYGISGLCAALGGVVHTFYIASGDPNFTVGSELDAIAAVVIGGTLLTGGVGYVFGTFVGVLILGVIQEMLPLLGTLNAGWSRVVIGLLLMLFIVLQRAVGARRQ
jgi:simple sugar transport system permease protein